MDEQALIAAAQQGDTTAFNHLVLQYQDMVYHTAYRILGDPDSAADAAQEAFISAYHGLPRFRGGIFKVWLLRIVTNACYDELRRRKRRPADSLELLPVEQPLADSPLNPLQESPEAHLQRQELGRLLQAGIETLPAEQRVVLVLADVQGLSYEEVAEAMGLPKGTVKSRLHRARSKLRDYLQQREELLPVAYRLASRMPEPADGAVSG